MKKLHTRVALAEYYDSPNPVEYFQHAPKKHPLGKIPRGEKDDAHSWGV